MAEIVARIPLLRQSGWIKGVRGASTTAAFPIAHLCVLPTQRAAVSHDQLERIPAVDVMMCCLSGGKFQGGGE